MLIMGNKFDEKTYEIEDTKTNEMESIPVNKIIEYFKETLS